MAQPSKLLDPAVLTRINPLGFKAARVVEGSITGQHRSPLHGVSPEFAEHREYSPGDDVKNLDWKVWAKSDRFVIKRYEEESNLRCTMLVDASRSMQYAGKDAQEGRTKFETAATIAACMTQLLMKQRDSVGLITIDTKPRAVLQPKATSRQMAQILDTLANCGREVRVYGLGEQPGRGGLVFRPISEQGFVDDLASCHALVSTAGNQLVGEAAALGKPVLAIPEERNREQEINAHYVRRLALGDWTPAQRFDAALLGDFLERLHPLRSRRTRPEMDGTDEVLDEIEALLEGASTARPAPLPAVAVA